MSSGELPSSEGGGRGGPLCSRVPRFTSGMVLNVRVREESLILELYNRISQSTPAHGLAAAIISPLCCRCLSRRVQHDEDKEGILYPIPEIEEEEDEGYVVLNTEDEEEEEGGLIEVLITIEASVHFEIDSILAEEEWSIVDEVSLAGEDDLVFVDASHDGECEFLDTTKNDALMPSAVEIAPAPVSRPRLSMLGQMVNAVRRENF
ncbi:hypothetical protein JOM56_010335 [Amanita muscaria]